MKNKNTIKKISLTVALAWLICGLTLTILESKNILFILFLGLGIFFTIHTLKKNKILI